MDKFYLYEGETWVGDDKKLRFRKVSDPETTMQYTSIHPDTLDGFSEIVPNPDTYQKNHPQEKLFRVVADLSTVIFLSDQSFSDISRNVLNYLGEIEEWERMCIVRDIGKYYSSHQSKRKAMIDDFIRQHDKPAAKGDS